MTGETRAPDPTLRDTICLAVIVRYGDPGAIPTAHRIGDYFEEEAKSVCGITSVSTRPSQEAQWFAVPCRECFPDAPGAGTRWMEGKPPGFWRTDTGLAWQLAGQETP